MVDLSVIPDSFLMSALARLPYLARMTLSPRLFSCCLLRLFDQSRWVEHDLVPFL